MHEPLFENDARGSHHDLAATAAHSREAGYIHATVIVVTSKILARGGPYIFCQQVLQSRIVEHGVRQKLLRRGVLAFEPLQSLGLGVLEPAVLNEDGPPPPPPAILAQ
jgi:hypothetical protein